VGAVVEGRGAADATSIGVSLTATIHLRVRHPVALEQDEAFRLKARLLTKPRVEYRSLLAVVAGTISAKHYGGQHEPYANQLFVVLTTDVGGRYRCATHAVRDQPARMGPHRRFRNGWYFRRRDGWVRMDVARY